MLKPVSILALDPAAASLAGAVQKRVAATHELEDLVQVRALVADTASSTYTADLAPAGTATNVHAKLPPLPALADAVESIHERWQAPDSPQRNREDISNRELVLLVLSTAGPGRLVLLDLARQLRQLYQMRMTGKYYTVEAL